GTVRGVGGGFVAGHRCGDNESETAILAASAQHRQTMTPAMPFPYGLYAISSQTADTPALMAWADAVIDGGAYWLQYRDKSGDHERRLEQAKALAALCRRRGTGFIVNDDVALAR